MYVCMYALTEPLTTPVQKTTVQFHVTSSPNFIQFDAEVGSQIRLLPFRGNNQLQGVCVQKVRAMHPTGLPRRTRLPFSQPQRRTDSHHSTFAVELCNGHLSIIILLLLGLTNTTSTKPKQKDEILLIKGCFPWCVSRRYIDKRRYSSIWS